MTNKNNTQSSINSLCDSKSRTSPEIDGERISNQIADRTQFLIFQIPANIDIDVLLVNHPINIPNAKDYLLYLMHLIHSIPASSKNISIIDTNGHTILNSTYLQNIVDNYRPLLDWLIDLHILQTDGSYIAKKKSMGYKFTPQYQVELKKVRITNKILVKKLTVRKWRKHNVKRDKIQLQPEHLFLYSDIPNNNYADYSTLAKQKLHFIFQWLNSDISVNYDAAIQYLYALKSLEEKHLNKEYAIHNFNCRKLTLDNLKNITENLCHVDSTSGRLHSPFTYLLSDMRAFISREGAILVSADIKNSQPLLSLVFLDYELFQKNEMQKRLAVFNPKNFGVEDSGSLCSMLGDFIQQNEINHDTILYRELVISGEIYEYFGNLLKEKGAAIDIPDSELRAYAKKQLFTAFFSRNNAIFKKDAVPLRIFKEHFPTVFEIFSYIKTGTHNALACSLQNLEAEIVLHKSCRDIHERAPNALMITIHDSIATTSDNFGLTEEILKGHLFNAINADVNIKREDWNESLLKRINSPRISLIQAPNISGSLYGFHDETYPTENKLYSFKYIAKRAGIKSNKKLYHGLRNLGYIQHDEFRCNIPNPAMLDEKQFPIIEKKWRFRTIRTLKATSNGVKFILNLINTNPNEFQ
ncbi:hypothetical protein [Niabella hirudinis]|uniref:hypothetical protein n=1 Tax=Niabella hirudinis TaxID=1285929 RepID=UPI003EC1105E